MHTCTQPQRPPLHGLDTLQYGRYKATSDFKSSNACPIRNVASRAGAARATAELRMLKIDQLAFGGNLPAWPTVIL